MRLSTPFAETLSRSTRSFVRALALLALSAIAAFAPCAEAQTIPAADFFKPSDLSELSVSPSGKRMSALVPAANGRMQLAIFDLHDLTRFNIVASYLNADVIDVDWVNDDRLVYRVIDRQSAFARQHGTGLFAVDEQGSSTPRMLIRQQYDENTLGTHITQRALDPNDELHSVLRDGSNDVVVVQNVYANTGDLHNVNLLRLDTTSGVTHNLSQGAPEEADAWTLDAEGRPRVVMSSQGGKETIYWKSTPDAAWQKVAESPLHAGVPFVPLYVDADNHLYASAASHNNAQTSALVSIDMAQGLEKRKTVLSAEGFDFVGSLAHNAKGAVLGIRYLTDARATYWFDPGMKKIQEQVDALLPGTNNQLDCGTCDLRTKVLVTSTSDHQPGAYRLFDTETGTLAPIGEARPWIKPKTMADRDMVRISARDGLSMPVHITKPPGQKGPAPMVVLVHGGPWLRGGEWQWDADSQFLASRGYVVVEPEFRGSTGFGYKHFQAGWKQWGLAMQDDVADAAQWAIRQGYADPKRICIAGGSYGGYATLMGLIRNPELFRCGVDFFGVTDIDLMYSITWSDSDDKWKRFGMPQRVGDREKDAAQLAATSPIKLAGKVTQPLLMAYGGVDRRVPIEHGTQFRDAVRNTNKSVDWVVYADEGHGFMLPANEIDFWTRVDRFLDANLKNAP
jgi:acetyl esterase/lipase